MFVPGVITFVGLSACCLVVSVYMFRKPTPRLPEWRWISVILSIAFGFFAYSFARAFLFACPVADALLLLAAVIELVVALRREQFHQ